MLSPQVHYTFDGNGLLTSNKVLDALYARFNDGFKPSSRKEKAYIK
jgi:hypothetical protein